MIDGKYNKIPTSYRHANAYSVTPAKKINNFYELLTRQVLDTDCEGDEVLILYNQKGEIVVYKLSKGYVKDV